MTTDKHTITLYVRDGIWIADHSDPYVIDLFGGCGALPTPYTDQASAAKVLSRISALNPEYDVRLADQTMQQEGSK